MKKNIFLALLLAMVSFHNKAQSLDYQDLALLFSKNDLNGTARFTAMGGAFGAVGGDISSININPAGLSIFNNSYFSGTLNLRDTQTQANYFGTNVSTQNQYVNFSQAGAALVFDTSKNSDWNKIAVGFNYRLTNDFDNSFVARGNSNIATFTNYPLDINNPALVYDIADEQIFRNDFRGELSELNVAFSALYSNDLHVGLSLNFYDLNFEQQNNLTEFNSDINGNQLDANLYQESFITGTGFSANLGFIYRPNNSFRIGLSYQTPTWYGELFEENNLVSNDGFFGDTEIIVSNDALIYDNTAGGNFPFQELIYSLKTPGTITASTAFIFGKRGLISVDYQLKRYANFRFSNNNSINDVLDETAFKDRTHNIRLGTEWRFNRLSLRAGYRFEQTPFNSNNFSPSRFVTTLGDISSYSFGGGYSFGIYKVDVSYSNTTRDSSYNFYQGFGVNPANLVTDTGVFTATFSIGI